MTIVNTDLLVVQRDDTAYKVNFENLKTSVIDGLDESQRTTIIADAMAKETSISMMKSLLLIKYKSI